ncbi:MAG: ferrous iron transporter B [Christensenellaceae bacterium]|nr:ferrous iron transporter B [Christensenellaceae bacterium]
MSIRIALAGNPNSGKTTLFNALTGSNQFVGNWPGVTVEKKEGKLKKHSDVILTDLPGIYSLSPYTLEEVVARNYLIDERPDAILNIVDGSNLERNLYLTTQLTELGIPVVIAINMMDVVKKNGDKIDISKLSELLGCRIVDISALKGTNVDKAAEAAIEAAKSGKTVPKHTFDGAVEHAIAHIEEAIVHDMPEEQQRWYAIKVFERDEKVLERLNISAEKMEHIEKDIADAEEDLEDDAESIITNGRYVYIAEIMKGCYKKAKKGELTTSDKIDRVLTNRWAALPIFAAIMFVVYFVSVTTVGTILTDWANDGVFGDGWHLFGIGQEEYEEADGEYGDAANVVNAFIEKGGKGAEETAAAFDSEAEDYDGAAAVEAVKTYAVQFSDSDTAETTLVDEETMEPEDVTYTGAELKEAVSVIEKAGGEAPDPASYGVWVPGLPGIIEQGLDSINCNDVVKSLILDGVVAGVGAVLGFVPQILVLFIFLAFLESCGYMARIAFVMDRIFRKFGLSGKSFIPILIGTGCGIPGIMASRTIENERDRRMTIMTTTFIPCGAKLPFIAMVAGAIFGGAAWVAPTAYFLGIGAIIMSGIILKKTKMFAGDPAPFVMELPAYHWPTVGNVLRSMWERGWSFIKKAGTIILISTIVIWFLTYFGWVGGEFRMLADEEVQYSILAAIGNGLSWIFAPLGFGNWQATVASITGLVAKENIVGTMSIVYGGGATVWPTMAASFTALSGFAFLTFNLLCAPCFAAMGAIKREMNSAKWFWRAIGYQCGLAWIIALIIFHIGGIFTGECHPAGVVVAIIFVVLLVWGLARPYKESNKLDMKVRIK